MQWFVSMKEFAQPALEAVMNDDVQLHPAKFKNTYRHWMENVKDWCISRQLWWGHRIPAWYLPNSNDFVVAETEEEALKLAQDKTGNKALKIQDLRQEEDVLDTWFSSWLWPISVFDGINQPNNNADLDYYYPTNDLVTAPEILFFWVARMIIAGYEYKKEKPFSNVYLTGIVRDKAGRKMSKSLGNSPDPIELMNQYSADGVRTGMLFSSPAGNDLLFDVKLCEQGRNFSNKIWNALRLVKGWETSENSAPQSDQVAVRWFESRFNQALIEIEGQFRQYRISDALMIWYKLIWNDFCSWYLEIVKPGFGQPINAKTYESTLDIFEKLMKVLHPFMPFITEEIWHQLRRRESSGCIMVSAWPKAGKVDTGIIEMANLSFEVIANVRNIRQGKQIPFKTALDLYARIGNRAHYERFFSIIQKLANVGKLEMVDEKVAGAVSFMVKTDEWYVPLETGIDQGQEIENISKEIEYTKGFLLSVMKKLGNERFVANAPEKVVDMERQKKEDAENKLQTLKERLAHLKNQ